MRRSATRPVIHALLMTTATAWSIDMRASETPQRPASRRDTTSQQQQQQWSGSAQMGMAQTPAMYCSTPSGGIGRPNRKP